MIPQTAEKAWVTLIASSLGVVLVYDVAAIYLDEKSVKNGGPRYETLSKTLRRKKKEHWGYIAVPTVANIILWMHLYGDRKMQSYDPIGLFAKLIRKVVK